MPNNAIRRGTVLNTYVLTGALVAACSGVALAAQQQPATQPQAPQTQTQPRPGTQQTEARAQSTTVIGCVYRERDVPGRAPNVAERVGILEDYILAEVTGEAGSAGAPGAGATAGTSGAAGARATGTSGAGRMYKLEFVDDDRLQDLVGKRVEVTGKIDAEAGDSKAPAGAATTSTTDKVIGRDAVNLSEFEVASIKEVAGSCPSLK
jgi:hypothetical protein